MRRREVISLVGAAALWPALARAQTPPKMLRLGYVANNPRSAPFNAAFERRLRSLGYVEGQNLIFDYIDGRGQPDLTAEGMREVVRRGADIVMAAGPEISLKSAMAATSTLPIVMIAIDYDPFALGYVKSLARPGGQVTGVFFQQIELAAKRLELMKETLPGLKAATVFYDRLSADQWKASEKAAPGLGLRLAGIDLGSPPFDYEKAIGEAPPDHRRALMVMASPLIFRDSQRLADFALARNLAAMFAFREHVDAGGLISYGANLSSLFTRAADFVDRIAKGDKPADLPIEQPVKFEMVINLKTAQSLGLTIPVSIIARADEVIE